MKNLVMILCTLLMFSSCETEKEENSAEVAALKMTVASQKNELLLSKEALKKEEEQHLHNLTTSMKILTFSHSISLKRMCADFAITDIIELVSRTVAESEHIVRGIYMTNEQIPFVYATDKNPSGQLAKIATLKDSITTWCVTNSKNTKVVFTPFQDQELKESQLLEFCAPVMDDGIVLGYIRYTFSHELLSEHNFDYVN